MGRFNSEQTEAICDLVDMARAARYIWPQQEHHQRIHQAAQEADASQATEADTLKCWDEAVKRLLTYFDTVLAVGVPWETVTHIMFRDLPYDLAKHLTLHPDFGQSV